MKQLKVETGARIKVADAVPNCEERVVIMSSPPDLEVQWNCAQVCQLKLMYTLLCDNLPSIQDVACIVHQDLVDCSIMNVAS